MRRKNSIKYVLVICLAMSISFRSSMWVRASGETPIENAAEGLGENTGEEAENINTEDREEGKAEIINGTVNITKEETEGTDEENEQNINGTEESTEGITEEKVNREETVNSEDVNKEENINNEEDVGRDERSENLSLRDAEAEDSGEREDAMMCVELPPEYESGQSPFDFILDPQGVINATDAVRYGGRSFEEGATLYFGNTNGEYDFSGRSDELEIINKGTAAVHVTVNAELMNIEDVGIAGDDSFTDDDTCSIYLAIADNRGNYVPLDEHGKAVIQGELAGVAGEETDAVYSFYLTGACNPNGDWKQISDIPYVVVSWLVEPVINEDVDMEEDIVSERPQETEEIGATASANVAYKEEEIRE